MQPFHSTSFAPTRRRYGDISPMQPMEYLVGVLCQCAGGIMWAFVIGVFSSLLSTANPSKIRFRQTMDDLNHMMDVRGPRARRSPARSVMF